MPYKISKTGQNKYKVTSPNSVLAKGTSLEKAKAQVRAVGAATHKPKAHGRKSY